MKARTSLHAIAAIAALGLLCGAAFAQSYHTYPQIESQLAATAAAHPDICRLVNIGKSVQNRNTWALCITDNPLVQEDEPEFRYVSSLHGDEIIGIEMCLSFIDYLTVNYGVDSRITSMVDGVEIWVVPCANPDGFVAGTRGNSRGVDLNRNFPCPYTSPQNTTAGRELETANLMNFAFSHTFTLSSNFHSGALVVNYPFDGNASGASVDTPTPDDDMFEWISLEYSQHNLPMWNSSTFYHGITNGADWYVIYGGMQDWSYVYMGCNDVTIELANSTPSGSQIPTYWNYNRESMLSYVETCLSGVRGLVTDAQTGLPLAATVSVVGRDHDIFTDPDVGDYHRMLMPGTYTLVFEADGYDRRTISGVVVNAGNATRLDVALLAPAHVLTPNGGESLEAGQASVVSWSGAGDARFQVQQTTNYGQTATITDGFEAAVLDPAFTTGGNAPWTTTTSAYHTGTRSARGGVITHNQTTWLSRSVNGPGSVQFWYRVSSESGYDFFTFYIDGQSVVRRAGTVNWTLLTSSLTAGPHVLKWEYSKDGSASSGSDTAWIDDLQIVQDATVWADIAGETAVGVQSIEWTPTVETQSAKVRVRALYGESRDPGLWDESDAVFAVVAPACPGDLDADNAVGLTDLAILLSHFGTSGGATPADGDLDGDADVDLADLTVLLSNFGEVCP
ncbi:MAG: DUF2817 domain-containing protein [Planctomycetes bacterium]|nr:DUF2817 domain-containing protein [Planctomycetota bacterium]